MAGAPSTQLRRAVEGKVVVVTGASDGIGARLAERLGAAGACVLLVARSAQKLAEVVGRIRAHGGEAHDYLANIACEADCERVLGEILRDHGRVDIFVSNAGRSIRRSVKYQASDRFHDFQRLMALNYFGALRLVLGVLPGMAEQGAGQVIHVSSFGVPSRQPRFAGYAASKSALDVALQCAAGEVASRGVRVSTVYMPLVQTKMVESKGHSYDHFPLLTVDTACEYVEQAIVSKRAELFDSPTRFLALLQVFAPSFLTDMNSLIYRCEGERPPDGVPAGRSARRLRAPRGRRSDRILRLLGSLLWFFSNFEVVLVLRCGMPWAIRDLIALLVVALVLLVWQVCLAVLALARGSRACRRRALGSSTAVPAGEPLMVADVAEHTSSATQPDQGAAAEAPAQAHCARRSTSQPPLRARSCAPVASRRQRGFRTWQGR